MTAVLNLRSSIPHTCCVMTINKKKGDTISKINLKSETGDWLVIDFDKPGSPLKMADTRPDYLFVSDRGGVKMIKGQTNPGRLVPIEMSQGRSKNLRKLSSQLQAAINWVESVLDEKHKPTLVPIFVGTMNHHVWNQLKRRSEYRVAFRGQKVTIRRINSGNSIP